MSTQKQLSQVKYLAEELLMTINNESWDEAIELSQKWDADVRAFINSLTAEQFITMSSDIEKITETNTIIKDQVIDLRAKVLTQIQNNKHTQTAIQQYNNNY